MSTIEFTGERAVEGVTPKRIWLDHTARYEFASHYVSDKTVLDIACGTGFGAEILKRAGAKSVLGIDISHDTVRCARGKYAGDGLSFKMGNIYNIECADNSVDVITSFETIEHIDDRTKALCELKRVLKPGGLLIISTPNRRLTSPGKSICDPPDNIYHLVEYSQSEFAAILTGYFENIVTYGQRAVHRIFFIPIFEKLLRRVVPDIYGPESGNPSVQKAGMMREFRYIVVCCNKSKE